MSSWNKNEKELLVDLFDKMGYDNLNWRDDAVIRPIDEHTSLLYSIDNAEQIYQYASNSKNLRCYGRWTASVVANDIIACGTLPKGLSLDVGINNMNEEEFYHFVQGVLDTCKCYGMVYEGGNLNTVGSVSGVAWGLNENDRIIRRSGSGDGDILFATCNIGVGWGIRLLLEKGIHSTDYIDLINNYKELPMVNLELFQEIWAMNAITCGMDLTDGIIELGYEIFDRSKLGVIFDVKNSSLEFLEYVSGVLDIPKISLSFEPGYDTPFAHGWCIKKEKINQVINLFCKYGAHYTILGEVSKEYDGVYTRYNNELIKLPRYWDDKIGNRGNVMKWKDVILKMF